MGANPLRYERALSEELSKTVPGEAFAEPRGVAFDSSGNLLVADVRGHGGEAVIDKFDSSNVFQAQLGGEALSSEFPSNEFARGVALSDESGHMYVADGPFFGEIVVLNPTGEELSRWGGANTPERSFGERCCYLYDAVDNSTSPSRDDVYVMKTNKGGHVYVFEPQGEDKEEGKFVRELEVPGGFALEASDGLAVDDATGHVYVVDPGHLVVDRFSASGEFEAAHQLKGPSASEAFKQPIAVAVDGASGHVFVLDHGVGNQGVETIDEFDREGELLNQVTETGPNEPLGAPVAVAVQRAGAHAGDIYVSDSAKKVVDVFAQEEPEPPAIEGEGVTQLTGDSVSFAAEINPRGSRSEYRFEYGLCPSPSTCASGPYEIRMPQPDALLGAEDFATHSVPPVHVQGLSASSTYHFRVVAHNAHGERVGEERIFTTRGAGGALALLDDRMWELVSPPDKGGGALSKIGEQASGVIEAAASGGAISYLANAPTEASPEGNAGEVQVLSRRAAGGWQSRDIAPAHEAASGTAVAPEYRYFSEELTEAVVQPLGPFTAALSSEASEQTAFLRALGDCASNCYHPLVTGKVGHENVPAGTVFGETEEGCAECGPLFLAASGDSSHFVLRSQAALVPGAPASELYEWAGGRLALLSVLPPNGKGEELPAPTGPSIGDQPLLGSQFEQGTGTARRAISSNGARVFWESQSKLYVRDTALGQTLQLDAPEAGCGGCEGGAGRFQIASADGSRVYFTDMRRLTSDAGAKVKAPDLYECRIALDGEGKLACALADLTPLQGSESANVQGDVLGASQDGSIIYFVADGALLGSGAQSGTCIDNGENGPQPPGVRCNLYMREDGQPTKLVAALSGADAKDWARSPSHQLSRVSPDGRWLAFMSAHSLTGYDNRDALSGQPDAEAFLYGEGGLVCAACNPTGARPSGVEYRKLEARESGALPGLREEWEQAGWVSALLPHATSIGPGEPGYQPRYLNDSGRLFFNSMDALVPQDVNGTGDVYEYEPSGLGSCEGEGGCVELISSGASPEASSFLDASASGDDVFFMTAQRLTPQDVDSREDVYDAHVCSSALPCFPTPSEQPPPCSTEASCKAAPTPLPEVFGAPASATLVGAGNLIPAPPAAKPKKPTRADRLAKALRTCHKRYPRAKKRRLACERQARARYGAKHPGKGSMRKGKRR